MRRITPKRLSKPMKPPAPVRRAIRAVQAKGLLPSRAVAFEPAKAPAAKVEDLKLASEAAQNLQSAVEAHGQVLAERIEKDPAFGKQCLLFTQLYERQTQLQQEFNAHSAALEAWRDESGGFASLARVGAAALTRRAAEGQSFREAAGDAELLRKAPPRREMDRVAERLDAVEKAIANLSAGKPVTQGVGEGVDLIIDEVAHWSAQEGGLDPRLQLSQRLKRLETAVEDGDRDKAKEAYRATTTAYLKLPAASGESAAVHEDGSASLTGVVNELITQGAIRTRGHLVLTSNQLERALPRIKKDWKRVGRALQAGGTSLGKFDEATFKQEIARLRELEKQSPHADLLGGTSLRQVNQLLAKVPETSGVTRFVKGVGGQLLRIADSPETWAMVAVGALTGRRASNAILRGNAVDSVKVVQSPTARNIGRYAATCLVDGATFHTGMNLFNVARGKRDRASWSAQAYFRAGLNSAIGGVARGRHVVRVDANRGAGIKWQALEQARFLGEEAAASSTTAVVESYLRTGDFSQASQIVSDNLQYLLAMRILHGAKKVATSDEAAALFRRLLRQSPEDPEAIRLAQAAAEQAKARAEARAQLSAELKEWADNTTAEIFNNLLDEACGGNELAKDAVRTFRDAADLLRQDRYSETKRLLREAIDVKYSPIDGGVDESAQMRAAICAAFTRVLERRNESHEFYFSRNAGSVSGSAAKALTKGEAVPEASEAREGLRTELEHCADALSTILKDSDGGGRVEFVGFEPEDLRAARGLSSPDDLAAVLRTLTSGTLEERGALFSEAAYNGTLPQVLKGAVGVLDAVLAAEQESLAQLCADEKGRKTLTKALSDYCVGAYRAASAGGEAEGSVRSKLSELNGRLKQTLDSAFAHDPASHKALNTLIGDFGELARAQAAFERVWRALDLRESDPEAAEAEVRAALQNAGLLPNKLCQTLGDLVSDNGRSQKLTFLRGMFKELQDEMDPMAPETAKAEFMQGLVEEVGLSSEEAKQVATGFDFDNHLGSGTIACTYAGVIDTPEGRQHVVAKVQRPEAKVEFERAPRIAPILGRVLSEAILRSPGATQQDRAAGELIDLVLPAVGERVMLETDFAREVLATESARQAAGLQFQTLVPKVVKGLSNSRTIFMQRIDSERIESARQRLLVSRETELPPKAEVTSDTAAEELARIYSKKLFGLEAKAVEVTRDGSGGFKAKVDLGPGQMEPGELDIAKQGDVVARSGPAVEVLGLTAFQAELVGDMAAAMQRGKDIHYDKHGGNVGWRKGNKRVDLDFGSAGDKPEGLEQSLFGMYAAAIKNDKMGFVRALVDASYQGSKLSGSDRDELIADMAESPAVREVFEESDWKIRLGTAAVLGMDTSEFGLTEHPEKVLPKKALAHVAAHARDIELAANSTGFMEVVDRVLKQLRAGEQPDVQELLEYLPKESKWMDVSTEPTRVPEEVLGSAEAGRRLRKVEERARQVRRGYGLGIEVADEIGWTRPRRIAAADRLLHVGLSRFGGRFLGPSQSLLRGVKQRLNDRIIRSSQPEPTTDGPRVKWWKHAAEPVVDLPPEPGVAQQLPTLPHPQPADLPEETLPGALSAQRQDGKARDAQHLATRGLGPLGAGVATAVLRGLPEADISEALGMPSGVASAAHLALNPVAGGIAAATGSLVTSALGNTNEVVKGKKSLPQAVADTAESSLRGGAAGAVGSLAGAVIGGQIGRLTTNEAWGTVGALGSSAVVTLGAGLLLRDRVKEPKKDKATKQERNAGEAAMADAVAAHQADQGQGPDDGQTSGKRKRLRDRLGWSAR